MRILRRGMRGPDVRRWQRALIEWGLLGGRADGIFGPRTEAATIAFQREYHLEPDGVAGPATLGRAGLLDTPAPDGPVAPAPVAPPPPVAPVAPAPPSPVSPVVSPAPSGRRVTITAPLLRRVMPSVGQARSVEYAPFLQRAIEEFAIDTPPRAAAFLAQLAHESGELRFMEELWGPTAAQRRYEPPTSLAARLGNTQPGDGKRFKGRGPIQLTGRANYRVFGDALGLDLIARPALAASKEVAFRIAGLYWKKRGLNPLADRQDFRRITRLINGGFNGLADRLRFWDRAKQIFDVRRLPAGPLRGMRRPGATAEEAPDPRFRRGLDAPGEITPTVVERNVAARALRAPAPRRTPRRGATPKKATAARTGRGAAAKTGAARAPSRRRVPKRAAPKKKATGAKPRARAKTSSRTRRTGRPRPKRR